MGPSHRLLLAVTIFIIALGGALRFTALNRQSIWNDEAFTVSNIIASWHEAAFQPVNNHPPFYFAQLRLWRSFSPVDPHSLRGLSFLRANAALWGSVSLILFYFLGRRFFNPWMNTAGVAIMSFSPLHMAYSQDARPYSLAVAEGLAGFLLLDWIVHRTRRANILVWFAVGILWALELYTHYWGIFIVTSQLIFGLTSAPKNYRKPLVASFLGAGIAFAPWWPVLKFHLHETSAHRFELFTPNLVDLGRTFVAFSGFQFQFANQPFVHPWPHALIAIGLILIAALSIWGLVQGPRLAIVWLAIGVGLPFLISYRWPIYLWYRYPFLSYGAFVLLLVAGLGRISWHWLQTVFILFILSAEGTACFHYFDGWQKGNAKPAIEYAHHLQTETSVLVRPQYFSDVMSYYDMTPKKSVIDEDNLDSPEKRAALQKSHIIFLDFDVPSDPIGKALLTELPINSQCHFPAISLHGITVYELGLRNTAPR